MGLTLEGASKEEIAELDRLLSVMADMRAPETGLKQAVKEGERERREVRDSVKEGKEEKPTWGTTIAGVSTTHACILYLKVPVYEHNNWQVKHS